MHTAHNQGLLALLLTIFEQNFILNAKTLRGEDILFCSLRFGVFAFEK